MLNALYYFADSLVNKCVPTRITLRFLYVNFNSGSQGRGSRLWEIGNKCKKVKKSAGVRSVRYPGVREQESSQVEGQELVRSPLEIVHQFSRSDAAVVAPTDNDQVNQLVWT